MKFCLKIAAFLSLLTTAVPASAAQVIINTGVNTSVPQIASGVVNLLLLWSGLVTTAVFLIGCILMVGSGGNDALLSNGKKIMKAALIGLAIILSSWLIISTTVFFLAA